MFLWTFLMIVICFRCWISCTAQFSNDNTQKSDWVNQKHTQIKVSLLFKNWHFLFFLCVINVICIEKLLFQILTVIKINVFHLNIWCFYQDIICFWKKINCFCNYFCIFICYCNTFSLIIEHQHQISLYHNLWNCCLN